MGKYNFALGFQTLTESRILCVLKPLQSGTLSLVKLLFINSKSSSLARQDRTTCSHKTFRGNTWIVEQLFGIGVFLGPLKNCICTCLKDASLVFSCASLGIRGRSRGESREAGGVEYDWVTIVVFPLVCFSPFWVFMCASKLSDMTWINLFVAPKPVRRELSVLLLSKFWIYQLHDMWRSPYIHVGVHL